MSKQATAKMISIEGIEGVGKSTNMDYVEKLLEQNKLDVIRTREPGGTKIGEAIRQILLSEHDEPLLPITEVLLLYAGRYQHIEHVIKPALAQNQWVLCDRFFDASVAYQGAGRQIGVDKVKALNAWVIDDFKPNYTIILDAPVEVALKRLQQRGKLDRIEQEQTSFFERVRAAYLKMAEKEPKRFWVVDAQGDLASVHTQIDYIITEIVQTKMPA